MWRKQLKIWASVWRTRITVKHYIFCCILISQFWTVEISLHLAFSQSSTSIYQAFDGQTEFLRVFNFAILSYKQNLRKFDAREKYVLQYLYHQKLELVKRTYWSVAKMDPVRANSVVVSTRSNAALYSESLYTNTVNTGPKISWT